MYAHEVCARWAFHLTSAVEACDQGADAAAAAVDAAAVAAVEAAAASVVAAEAVGDWRDYCLLQIQAASQSCSMLVVGRNTS